MAWERWKMKPPAFMITPHTRPVSRHYWKTQHFEWVPKPGGMGMKSRKWNGKLIHKF